MIITYTVKWLWLQFGIWTKSEAIILATVCCLFEPDCVTENSCACSEQEHKEMARNPESSSIPPSHRNKPEAEAEACSQSAIGPKHKLLTLDTPPHDAQRGERIAEEFKDHDSQDVIHPILRRWPPISSPRDDNRTGSTPEETRKLDLKLKALPRPIETKRMLECLPTRLECRIFTADDITNATNHFADELKIGEGGYGPVYKATLDNTLVAIKILYSNITQGLKQFQQEVYICSQLILSDETYPVCR